MATIPRRNAAHREIHLHALTRMILRHRRSVLLAWAALFATGIALAGGLFAQLDAGFGLASSTESSRVEQAVRERGGVEPDLSVVVQSKDEPLTEATVQRIRAEVSRTRSSDGPAVVSSEVSAAGDTALLAVDSADSDPIDVAGAIRRIVEREGSTARVAGPDLFTDEFSRASEQDLIRGELVALPLVFIVVALLARSWRAGLFPFAMAFTTVGSSLAVLALAASLSRLNAYAVNVATMIGIALAVDYALLSLFRLREERRRGSNLDEATVVAAAAASRTALYSCLTMAGALSGLWLFPDPLLRSMAWGAVAVVGVTLLATVTLLPVVLSFVAPSVGPGRERRVSNPVVKTVALAQRRPLPVTVVCLLLLLLLGVPAAGLVPGGSGPDALPTSSESRQVDDLVKREFESSSGSTAVVLVREQRAARTLARSIAGVDGVSQVTDRAASGHPEVLDVKMSPELSTAAAEQTVREIRDAANGDALVGGQAASLVDFIDSTRDRGPWVALWIVAAVFALVAAMTGSIVLGAKAVAMGLLSLIGALGLTVLIFQRGSFDSVDASAAVILIVFAIGLSVDYEMFILQRISEEHGRGADTADAVRLGLVAVGPAVGLAALLMVIVFLGFGSGDVVPIKVIGVGLAVAVALDATVVRFLLLPATMQLLGRWNWWPRPECRSHPDPIETDESDMDRPRTRHHSGWGQESRSH